MAKIVVKSASDIEKMRAAGRLVGETLREVGKLIRPGVTTGALDEFANAFIRGRGAVPSFYRYRAGGPPYPKSVCVSVNEQVIHGIPGRRVLADGDIVSVDVGALLGGFHGDAARTFACGDVSPDAARLIAVTRECFFAGANRAREGCHAGDIGAAVEERAARDGFSVVRDYIGHGVGASLHEAPEIPNYRTAKRGAAFRRGMTIAVEPMVNAGGGEVDLLDDGWTVVTSDGSLSAHYENTILITDGEPEFLTLLEGEV
ncbi:MAG: type I methionyl aminopeptidase [Clostridiales bacterium]|jgi:methionyl aminopeptidase|nr:type I methionyl aminopeptidase [Clostridiales bacterium]